MEYFVSALWIVLEVHYIFLFFSTFLKKKKTSNEHNLMVLFLCLVVYIETNIPLFENIYPIITNTLIFVFSCWLFHGKWYARLFLQMAIILLSSIMDTAVAYGASLLMNTSFSEFVWMKIPYTIAGTVGKLLVLFLVWILYRLRTSKGLNAVQGKWFLLTILFPAVSFIMLALCYYNNQGNEEMAGSILLMSAVLAVANIGIIYLLHVLEKTMAREQEMALLKQQMNNWRK